jgi:hypothetical protein
VRVVVVVVPVGNVLTELVATVGMVAAVDPAFWSSTGGPRGFSI